MQEGPKETRLSKKHRKARLDWSRAHRNWGTEEWSKVLFSDESSFALFPGKEGWVRRREGEVLSDACLIPTVKHGGGHLMVWGAFHISGIGVLKRVEGTIDAAAYKQIWSIMRFPN